MRQIMGFWAMTRGLMRAGVSKSRICIDRSGFDQVCRRERCYSACYSLDGFYRISAALRRVSVLLALFLA